MQQRAVGQHDGAIDRVLQLAHIAGPVEGGQQGQGLGVSPATGLPSSALKRWMKARPGRGCPRGGRAAPAPRWGRRSGGRYRSSRKRPSAHLLRQVAVGGGDDAHVDLDRALGADRVDLAFLQGAQQLDLHVQRQLADLVQEQGAAVGLLELAQVLVGGAGEAALLVAEQDGFDQVLRDGAAVDGDERLAGALARRRGRRGRSVPCRRRFRPGSGRECRTWPPARPGDLTCFIAGDAPIRSSKVSVLLAFFFSRSTSPVSVPICSALRIETTMRSGQAGLTKKSLAPACMASTTVSMPPVAVSTMTGRSGLVGRSLRQHVQAAHVGHHQVQHHQRDLVAARAVDQVQRRLAAGRGDDLHAAAADRGFQQPALHRIVVNNQNGLRHDDTPLKFRADFRRQGVNVAFKPVPCPVQAKGAIRCLIEM